MARRVDTEQDSFENLRQKQMQILKKNYSEYVRNDFLEAFKGLHCHSNLNDPFLNKIFKTRCEHPPSPLNYKHNEVLMYVRNIITWLDPKMGYTDKDSTTKIIPRFKTSFIHDEERISRVCLHNTSITEPGSSKIQSTCDNGTSENILNSTKVNNLSDIKQLEEKSNSISIRKKHTIDHGIEHISKKRKAMQNNTYDESNSVKMSNNSTKKKKNMYRKNSRGETNLHDACRKGKLDVVTKLLGDGFNPNVKDNAGWTPLHEAVKNGHDQIVKKLIEYGAYLNVPGFEYETPLHTALYFKKFDIALLLYQNGADVTCENMYGINLKSLNEEKLSQLIKSEILHVPSRTKHVYESDQITIYVYDVSLTNDVVKQFCEQFNIKLIQNILRLKENELKQLTHLIVPETVNNTCDVNVETLTGIANGLFIVNQRWVSDSLEQNKLLSCEIYEICGTTNYIDYNGPKISRINKEKLYPKLFDGISIHLSGNVGWESFSPLQLQELIVKFGAKLLKRMPSPGNCNDTIFPYHCRNNMEMCNVSTIVLYTIDSNRLIKYNMKHLKAFPVSWFMEAIQKYTIL